jgi:protein TonB
VKVSFTVGADGGLKAVSVKASSGYDELDEAALSAVRDAAPFDPIPLEAGRQQLTLSITLRFSLN